jgi:hypothetical protein
MDAHSLKRRREDDGPGTDPASLGVKEHTLFVGALSEKTTEYQLSRLFKPYGPLVRLDILLHKFGPHRGQPRGFGFVELSNRDMAARAREALDGFTLNGKPMVVRFVSDRILYEGGMPAESAGSGARAGGTLKSGREYRTESERAADQAAASARGASQSVATNKVMAATLEGKLAAIKARLGLSAAPAPAPPPPRHDTAATASPSAAAVAAAPSAASVAAASAMAPAAESHPPQLLRPPVSDQG